MQYKNIFKMLTEICMQNKRFIECVKTELHLQLLLLFPVHCITAREQFSLNSCLLWIDQTLVPSSCGA